MQIEPQGDLIVLEGLISVDAALHAGMRPIQSILLRDDKHGPGISRVERAAERLGIPVKRVDAATIDSHSSGGSHGGVIAIAGPRRFMTLEELIDDVVGKEAHANPGRRSSAGEVTSLVEASAGKGWVIMIDGVEDPYNFGAAVRSAYAAGASGLVVRERNWFTAASVVARASAGASEAISTALASTAEHAASIFRGHGYAVVCADESANAVSLFDADLTGRFFLLIGGEKRGVTRSFREQADITLRIPYGNPSAHSLGTAAATAVIAFEVLRQRLAAGKGPQPPNLQTTGLGAGQGGSAKREAPGRPLLGRRRR